MKLLNERDLQPKIIRNRNLQVPRGIFATYLLLMFTIGFAFGAFTILAMAGAIR
jgi:hypothetical protein